MADGVTGKRMADAAISRGIDCIKAQTASAWSRILALPKLVANFRGDRQTLGRKPSQAKFVHADGVVKKSGMSGDPEHTKGSANK